MTLRHGGCPEMTRSIGSVDRIRWMSALAASAAIALLAALGLHQWQAPAARDTSGSGAFVGSSASLDPRIATLASHHPAETVSTIVQFKGGVSADRARWDITRISGHVFGELHIINALAVRLTA